MADFKIGKFRFTWRGDWTAAHSYVKDDVVRYGAKTYVCMVTHTSSANFYTDLNNTTTRWNEMVDGYEWTGDWAPTTFYQVNDLVKYSGIVYRCTTSHTSSSTLETSIANWTVHFSGDDWNNTWTASTYYNLNDIVKWGGIVYRCNTAHTSATYVTPTFLGLEQDLSKWTVVHSGIDYKQAWAQNTRYKKADVVKYNSSLWYCDTAHISGSLINETNFSLWLPGLGWEDEWQSGTDYTLGDVVSYGGYTYRAITNSNGAVPSTNPANWQVVLEQYKDLGSWSPLISYKVGEFVRHGNKIYVCESDHLNNEPPNATYWRLAIDGDNFKGVWTPYNAVTAPYNYIVGDIVSFQSSAYICVRKHTATVGNRPDNDSLGQDWQPYVLGNANNVLKLLGDMPGYGITDDGSTIGRNRIVIGDETQVLRVTNGIPDWQPFYQVPKVYYVSPLGSDAAGYGLTQDLPFASIKYACDYIQADLAARAPATIFVKSGVYNEILPIRVPADTVLVGDELRNPTVRPAAGYETQNMFLLRNSTTIRNMTLEGLSGVLGAANQYLTKRPTAGAYASLDPGIGPNDTSVWITTRSPYVQNVTTFGTGCVGLKVDGNLHNGGNKSIVANDFTQVLSDGIGAWVTNNGRAELVSVFTYYNHVGYLAENNGKIRATNGNNSYGDYGAVAEGDDPAELPKTAVVNNRSGEANVGFIFADGNRILRYEYANAGTSYTSATSTISGTGLNAATTHDEFRDGAIYQVRVAAPGDSSQPGGGGYVNVQGNAQGGTTTEITLSATDANDNGTYIGMRIIITSGLGVGQIGYITSYNSTTKVALISNEDTELPGWGHVVPGTTIQASLDTTTAYSIEPRLTFSSPGFTVTNRTLPASIQWNAVNYGAGKYVAVGVSATGAYSTNGTTWTSMTLPSNSTWIDVVYGNSIWVAITASSTAATSSNGISWSSMTMPSLAYLSIAYGGGRFVATSVNNNARYSTDGTTWTATTLPSASPWSSVTYGNGRFVAVTSSNNVTAYSTDGSSWTAGGSLPSSTTWSGVAYGNGRFVAIASGGTDAAYSLDNGLTWASSTLPSSSSWSKISYGQGLFIAVASDMSATSSDGVVWTLRTSIGSSTVFGNINNNPLWVGLVGSGTSATSIVTGAVAKVRARITSGRISSIRVIEPGSGYTANPVLTITDPNNTGDVVTEIRRGNGVLGNPSFSNRGTGYVTATTVITGNGYADDYQTGSYINVSSLTALPGPGANLTFATIADQTYSVVSIDNISGVAPSISARIRITPSLGIDESPIHGEAVEIREQYSQCRITGHDFLEIGTGTQAETNYPTTNLTNLAPENEIVQSGGGRVFYTSTDQDGNFRVGELFEVEQSTGVVSINADAFDLSGLTELRLGGVTLGGTGATIREFSTDPTFSANSNNIVPTQKAIKAYIASRIGGGGSDLDVNEIQVGSITFDAPNDIGHIAGFPYDINVTADANFTRGITGSALAMAYFKLGF